MSTLRCRWGARGLAAWLSLAVALGPAPASRPLARLCGPSGRRPPSVVATLHRSVAFINGLGLLWAAEVENDHGSPALRGTQEGGGLEELRQELAGLEDEDTGARLRVFLADLPLLGPPIVDRPTAHEQQRAYVARWEDLKDLLAEQATAVLAGQRVADDVPLQRVDNQLVSHWRPKLRGSKKISDGPILIDREGSVFQVVSVAKNDEWQLLDLAFPPRMVSVSTQTRLKEGYVVLARTSSSQRTPSDARDLAFLAAEPWGVVLATFASDRKPTPHEALDTLYRDVQARRLVEPRTVQAAALTALAADAAELPPSLGALLVAGGLLSEHPKAWLGRAGTSLRQRVQAIAKAGGIDATFAETLVNHWLTLLQTRMTLGGPAADPLQSRVLDVRNPAKLPVGWPRGWTHDQVGLAGKLFLAAHLAGPYLMPQPDEAVRLAAWQRDLTATANPVVRNEVPFLVDYLEGIDPSYRLDVQQMWGALSTQFLEDLPAAARALGDGPVPYGDHRVIALRQSWEPLQSVLADRVQRMLPLRDGLPIRKVRARWRGHAVAPAADAQLQLVDRRLLGNVQRRFEMEKRGRQRAAIIAGPVFVDQQGGVFQMVSVHHDRRLRFINLAFPWDPARRELTLHSVAFRDVIHTMVAVRASLVPPQAGMEEPVLVGLTTPRFAETVAQLETRGAFDPSHTTTQLMLEAMWRLHAEFKQAAVADIGTGSGVFGMVALQDLGAALVHATDADATSVAVATGNARDQGLTEGQMQVMLVGNPDGDPFVSGKRFDIALFNPVWERDAERCLLQLHTHLTERGFALLRWTMAQRHWVELLAAGQDLVAQPILEGPNTQAVFAIARTDDRLRALAAQALAGAEEPAWLNEIRKAIEIWEHVGLFSPVQHEGRPQTLADEIFGREVLAQRGTRPTDWRPPKDWRTRRERFLTVAAALMRQTAGLRADAPIRTRYEFREGAWELTVWFQVDEIPHRAHFSGSRGNYPRLTITIHDAQDQFLGRLLLGLDPSIDRGFDPDDPPLHLDIHELPDTYSPWIHRVDVTSVWPSVEALRQFIIGYLGQLIGLDARHRRLRELTWPLLDTFPTPLSDNPGASAWAYVRSQVTSLPAMPEGILRKAYLHDTSGPIARSLMQLQDERALEAWRTFVAAARQLLDEPQMAGPEELVQQLMISDEPLTELQIRRLAARHQRAPLEEAVLYRSGPLLIKNPALGMLWKRFTEAQTEQIPALMQEYLQWVNTPAETRGDPREFPTLQAWVRAERPWDVDWRDPIVHAAMAYWLLTHIIHPFEDGNGRTAQDVMNIMLARHRLPALDLRDVPDGDLFALFRADDDPTPFIDFIRARVAEARQRAESEAIGAEPIEPGKGPSDICIIAPGAVAVLPTLFHLDPHGNHQFRVIARNAEQATVLEDWMFNHGLPRAWVATLDDPARYEDTVLEAETRLATSGYRVVFIHSPRDPSVEGLREMVLTPQGWEDQLLDVANGYGMKFTSGYLALLREFRDADEELQGYL